MLILWLVEHFRKIECEYCGKRVTFARSSTDIGRSALARCGAFFLRGAALSQGQEQILWQAQSFCKVKRKLRGRHGTFARRSLQLRKLKLDNKTRGAPKAFEPKPNATLEVMELVLDV